MTHGTYVPFPIAQRQRAADFARGVYDDTLTGDAQYKAGDIVTVTGGTVARAVEDTTAASIVALAVSGQPWLMPKALSYYYDRGVPLNRISPEDEWVMNLAGTMDQTALNSVNAGESREILFNATDKALTIRAGTTDPAVKMLRVFRGNVDDVNCLIVVQFLPGVLY